MYRILLRREPGPQEVVNMLSRGSSNLSELLHEFLQSDEFQTAHLMALPMRLSVHDKYSHVESKATKEQLEQLFTMVQSTWEQLGLSEPHWSVLTEDRFRQSVLPEKIEEFYESGHNNVQRLLSSLDRQGVDLSKLHSCLDFGCGVGRVSFWLAKYFAQVHAVDISGPHLSLAREYLSKAGYKHIHYHRINHIPDCEDLPKVDLIYSYIVLQHNPPPVIEYLLRCLLRALRPGGYAYLQVPVYRRGYSFEISRYLDNRFIRENQGMEMHVLPQSRLYQVVGEEQTSLLEILEDDSTGDNSYLSNTFLVQKMS